MGLFAKAAALVQTAFRQDAVEVREDGWMSALMGYGVPGMDKRLATKYVLHDLIDCDTAEALWRSNDIAARIIEKVPGEALRSGYTIRMEDKELAEKIAARTEPSDLDLTNKLFEAMSKERAFGGAAIFPVMRDDVPDLSLPLNEERIVNLTHLQVFSPKELKPATWYTDPLEPKFGEPAQYWLYPRTRGGAVGAQGLLIHESRLIIFPGIRVSRDQVSPDDWGDSVLLRPSEVLRDFGISWAAVGAMLTDFSQATMQMKGLAELIAQDKDDVIKNRLKAVELSRSTIRATLLDADESYERKQTPVAGLADLLDRFESRLAAAADMPITVMMGRSPAGLNATGESDIRLFYDRIDVHRTLHLMPRLERLIRFIMLDRTGPLGGREPETWSIEFHPLWQPSEGERATTRKTVAETDNIYWNMGAVSADEIAKSRWGGDTYSSEMSIDWEERARLQAEEAAERAQLLLQGIDPDAPPDEQPDESADTPGEDTEKDSNEITDDDDIKVTIEEVDTDDDPKTPPDEYAVVKVREHERKIKLKRRKSGS